MTEQAAIRNIQSNTIQKLALLNIMPLKISVMICLLRLHYLMAIITVSVSPVFTVVARSRIFSKPIVKGKSLVSLSQEELESLNEALGERTNEEALTSAIVSK